MHLLGFGHGDDLGFETQVAGPGMGHLQPFHAGLRIGEDQAAGAMQTASLPGNLFKLVVKADGVALQFRDIGIAVQGVEAARRMPG